jgi:hypothetical protein
MVHLWWKLVSRHVFTQGWRSGEGKSQAMVQNRKKNPVAQEGMGFFLLGGPKGFALKTITVLIHFS